MAEPIYVYCRICGKPIPYFRVGRQKSFCSRSCRELAAMARAYWRGPVAQGRGGRVVHPAS